LNCPRGVLHSLWRSFECALKPQFWRQHIVPKGKRQDHFAGDTYVQKNGEVTRAAVLHSLPLFALQRSLFYRLEQ
jgi:hypothetical protein